MSLAQYLALGKSIKNVSGPGRYKIADGPVAPRFGGPRRVEPAQRRSSMVAVDTLFDHSQPPVAGVEERAEEPRPIVPPDGQEGIPSLAAASAAATPTAPSPRRWFVQPPPPAPAGAGRACQGELALGLVQPVRNDLQDSDLEVVPVTASAPDAPLPWWKRWWQWARPAWSRRTNRRSR